MSRNVAAIEVRESRRNILGVTGFPGPHIYCKTAKVRTGIVTLIRPLYFEQVKILLLLAPNIHGN
jgi:hypothetical protein